MVVYLQVLENWGSVVPVLIGGQFWQLLQKCFCSHADMEWNQLHGTPTASLDKVITVLMQNIQIIPWSAILGKRKQKKKKIVICCRTFNKLEVELPFKPLFWCASLALLRVQTLAQCSCKKKLLVQAGAHWGPLAEGHIPSGSSPCFLKLVTWLIFAKLLISLFNIIQFSKAASLHKGLGI